MVAVRRTDKVSNLQMWREESHSRNYALKQCYLGGKTQALLHFPQAPLFGNVPVTPHTAHFRDAKCINRVLILQSCLLLFAVSSILRGNDDSGIHRFCHQKCRFHREMCGTVSSFFEESSSQLFSFPNTIPVSSPRRHISSARSADSEWMEGWRRSNAFVHCRYICRSLFCS